MAAPDEADALQDCLAWAQARGAALHGVAIGPVAAGGRGVVAGAAGVAAGAALLTVPAPLLLSCATARASAPALVDAAATLRPEALLAAHLLHEVSKGGESRWAPYLRALPRAYTDGGGFSADEAEALQAPHAVAACEALRAARRADHAMATPLLRDALALPPRFAGWAAWSWAASTVGSRTVFYAEECASAGALCPIGDCCNHDVSPDGTAAGGFAYDAQTQSIVFTALRDTPPGEQVFITYGEHSDLALLLHYGFTLGPRNAHESALLPRSPHFDALPLEDEELRVDAQGAPGWRLLAALRLAAAPAALRRRHGHAAAAGASLSAASDAAAFARLRSAAADALASMGTTIEQDEAAVAAAVEGSRMQLALTWRLQHKRTLRAAVKAAETQMTAAQRALRDAEGATLVRG